MGTPQITDSTWLRSYLRKNPSQLPNPNQPPAPNLAKRTQFPRKRHKAKGLSPSSTISIDAPMSKPAASPPRRPQPRSPKTPPVPSRLQLTRSRSGPNATTGLS
jgi:hypothetical protein